MGLDMSRIWYCVRAGLLCRGAYHGNDGCLRKRRSGDGKGDEKKEDVMQGEFKLIKTNEQYATMTITMKMKHWKVLREQLPVSYPGGQLFQLIGNLVNTAEQVFFDKSAIEE